MKKRGSGLSFARCALHIPHCRADIVWSQLVPGAEQTSVSSVSLGSSPQTFKTRSLFEHVTVLLTVLKRKLMRDVSSSLCMTNEGQSDIQKCNSLYAPKYH